MLHEVDRALRTLLLTTEGAPEDLRVVFDPPTEQWVAAFDGTPTVNCCLYEVRSDRGRRIPDRDRGGLVLSFGARPHWYRLAYVVSAWSSGSVESRVLLGWVLSCLAALDALPERVLSGSLAQAAAPVAITVAESSTLAVADSLTALLGDDRPTLDVTVTAPVRPLPALPAEEIPLPWSLREKESQETPTATLSVGRHWWVEVVRAGTEQMALFEARLALDELVRHLGVEPDEHEVNVSQVMTDEGRGVRLVASGTIEDGPTPESEDP